MELSQALDLGNAEETKVSDGFDDLRRQLSLQKGDATANVRMNYLSKETMVQYFSTLVC